jgi:hypothetical protein
VPAVVPPRSGRQLRAADGSKPGTQGRGTVQGFLCIGRQRDQRVLLGHVVCAGRCLCRLCAQTACKPRACAHSRSPACTSAPPHSPPQQPNSHSRAATHGSVRPPARRPRSHSQPARRSPAELPLGHRLRAKERISGAGGGERSHFREQSRGALRSWVGASPCKGYSSCDPLPTCPSGICATGGYTRSPGLYQAPAPALSSGTGDAGTLAGGATQGRHALCKGPASFERLLRLRPPMQKSSNGGVGGECLGALCCRTRWAPLTLRSP